MFFSLVILFFALFSSTFGESGDVCRSDGLKGTCQKIASCSTGITVKGACPNDPDGIRCCIKKSCEDPSTKKQGMCYDKRNNDCSGGHYLAGQCPGDANMQCCIKSSTGGGTPAPPSCPAARSVPIKLFPDDVIFSRKGTQKTADAFKGVSKVLDVCALISAAIPGAGETVGIACGVASLGTEFIADHAEECLKKNQCLKLKAYEIPFCIGANDGCCG